jgi:hypothetical protein
MFPNSYGVPPEGANFSKWRRFRQGFERNASKSALMIAHRAEEVG